MSHDPPSSEAYLLSTASAGPFGVPLLDEIGLALSDALDNWDSWCHRKIESLILEIDERAMRHLSIDCTPFDMPLLNAFFDGTAPSSQIVLPLMQLPKEQISDFGLKDASGNILPLLERDVNGFYSALAMGHRMWELTRQPSSKDDLEALFDICRATKADARQLLTELLASPKWQSADSSRALERLRPFIGSFLALTVIPREALGQRGVYKLRYCRDLDQEGRSDWWSCDGCERHGFLARIACKASRLKSHLAEQLGFRPFALDFLIFGVEQAASYHVEFPLPPGVECEDADFMNYKKEILPSVASPYSTVHARLTNSRDATSVTAIQFKLHARESRLATSLTIAGIGATCFLSLTLLLDHALVNYLAHNDAASTLLLFGPTLWLAFTANSSESRISGDLLQLQRLAAWLLALCLGLSAVSLVGHLRDDLFPYFWMPMCVLSLACTGIGGATWVARLNRHRRKPDRAIETQPTLGGTRP